MWEFLRTYIITEIGSGLVHIFCASLNIMFLLVGGIFCMCMFRIKSISAKPTKESLLPSGKKVRIIIGWILSVLVIIWLFWLSYLANSGVFNEIVQSDDVTNDVIWKAFYDLLTPILSIDTLISNPVPGLPGLNAAIRSAVLFVLVYIARVIINWSWAITADVKEFADELLAGDTDDEKAAGVSGGNPTERRTKKITKFLNWIKRHKKACISGIGISTALTTFFGYIFGSNETRDSISTIFGTVKEFIKEVTLMSELKPIGNFSDIFGNFACTVLSILISAFYLTMTVMVFIFVYAIKNHWNDIQKAIRNHLCYHHGLCGHICFCIKPRKLKRSI